MKRLIGNADDRQLVVVDLDRLSDDVRIGLEVATPETMADHHDGMTAGGGFVGRQDRAAVVGTHPEAREVVAGDELRPDLPRGAAPAEVHLCQSGAEERGERAIVIAQEPVVRI